MLGDPLDDLVGGPRLAVELHPLAPVALDLALDPEEEIGPDRLRAGVAAPHPAEQRVRQEQGQRREDQEAGEIVDFLRPDLDEEEVEARMRDVGEDRLIRQVRPPVPADEGQDVVDAEGDPQHDPFEPPVGPPDFLRVDLLRRFVQRTLVVDLFSADAHGSSSFFRLSARRPTAIAETPTPAGPLSMVLGRRDDVAPRLRSRRARTRHSRAEWRPRTDRSTIRRRRRRACATGTCRRRSA